MQETFNPAEAFAAICLSAIASDGYLADEELDVLNQLYRALEINDTLALKIVEVMMIKNRG